MRFSVFMDILHSQFLSLWPYCEMFILQVEPSMDTPLTLSIGKVVRVYVHDDLMVV